MRCVSSRLGSAHVVEVVLDALAGAVDRERLDVHLPDEAAAELEAGLEAAAAGAERGVL